MRIISVAGVCDGYSAPVSPQRRLYLGAAINRYPACRKLSLNCLFAGRNNNNFDLLSSSRELIRQFDQGSGKDFANFSFFLAIYDCRPPGNKVLNCFLGCWKGEEGEEDIGEKGVMRIMEGQVWTDTWVTSLPRKEMQFVRVFENVSLFSLLSSLFSLSLSLSSLLSLSLFSLLSSLFSSLSLSLFFSSLFCLLSSVFCLLSSVFCLLSSVFCLLSSVFCLLSFVFLSFVFCLLSFVFCLVLSCLVLWCGVVWCGVCVLVCACFGVQHTPRSFTRRAGVQQLYQVQRMIGGIGNVLFSTYSQTLFG